MPTLSIALKEWDLVISDLLAGRQAILLRKGGILEANNEFELEHKRFLFYPTFIHQDPKMTKPERRAELRHAAQEPGEIEIRGYGEVARIFEVPVANGIAAARTKIDQLSDLHLWDAPLLDMRFAYRPEKPLYIVVIRAFRLPALVKIQNTLEYAGCKSWVPLEQEIDITNATQVLPDEQLTALIQRILDTLKN
ncbi:MAG TPA: DUF1802 family protein [Phycisphaerae bacterium]|nr:DUF1802 family protein [Phycisphaerae bacterium]